MIVRRVVHACLLALFAISLSAQNAELSAPVAPSANDRVAVLVELNEPGAAIAYANKLATASAGGGKRRATGAALQVAIEAGRAQYRRNLSAQAQIRPRLLSASSKAVPLFETQRVLNAIALEIPRADMDALRRVPGVRRVMIIDPEYPTNATSVPFLGTPAVWGDELGLGVNADGTGVSIGVIDTGIDYLHGTFGGSAALADYQANDRTVSPDAYYPTTKVVGGYDFAGDNYNGTAASIAADTDPMDCNGHGTHVAATAAGYGVTSGGATYGGPFNSGATYSTMRVGPGTAPKADLYALRVFGCGGSTNLTVQAIEWAVDPNDDGDVSDHLDVINMSLGSNFGSLAASSAIAADNAAKMGVIVVTSAGNAGDTYLISGAPGSGTRVLATAGSIDSGQAANAVRVNSPAGIAGFYTAGTAAFGSVPPAGGVTGDVVIGLDASDAAGPLTTDGCSPLTNAAAIAGKIALIDRGTCGFAVKVKNAQDAGAIAAVIANSSAGAFGNMGGADPTITIPSVMVTFADGNTLKANIATLNVTLLPGADTVYTSTSRGSRRFGMFTLKPDIAAPGVNITSAQTGVTCTGTAPSTGCQVANATGFLPDSQPLVLSGTSMASPHVAGIMALLRQLHPDWSVEELKAAAMNGALNDITSFPAGGGARFDPARIGAGRVDPSNSAVAQVLAFNDEDAGAVSLSFDLFSPTAPTSRTRRLRIVNRGATAVTYDLGLDIVNDAPGLAFSIVGSSSVTIPAMDSTTIDVELSATPAAMDHSRAATVSATLAAPASPASVATLGTQPRHWLTEESGYVTLSQSGDLKLRVPLYVASAPASQMSAAPTIATGGAPSGSTTIPLSGIDVCTGTLGAGPTCTGSFPNDEVSLVTPFELQVVSELDPFNAPGYADLQYAGVAYSAANDQIFFGASTWEPWGTPTDVSFNFYIDCGVYTNGASVSADTCNGVPDGNWDLILFNTNPGTLATLFGVSTAATDTFLTGVFVRTRNTVVFGPANYVNRVSAATADTRVFNNQVMFLAVDRTRLKINSTTGAFRYEVRTCPGSSPLCLALNGFRYDEEAGPFSWNYLAANQGLDFGGGNLYFDLNGATLPVTWNTANMTANGSLGALLLHHHNGPGRRAQAVLLDTSAASSDLSISISSAPVSPTVGTNVTLTYTATNSGPASATDVRAAIALPLGLTYVSDNSGGALDTGSGLWTIGALTGSTSLQIVATVDTSDPATTTARISGAQIDTDLSDNEAALTIHAPRSADLKLSMSTSTPTVTAGGNATYTITATNDGEDTAYAIAVAEDFASFPLLNPSAHSASHGVYNPASGIWNLAGLANGQSATLSITVATPNMAGSLTSQAAAGLDTSDPNTANNSASASVNVVSPSSISGTMSVTTTRRPGDSVTYVVTLTNANATDQQDNAGNEFTLTLPAGLSYVSASASSGTAGFAGGVVTWNGAIDSSVTITINATINSGVAAGTTISAQGSFNFDSDGNGTNETPGTTEIRDFVVISPVLLSFTKDVTGSYFIGGTVVYTITLQNTNPWGQADLAGDELTDVLPPQVTLVSASASSGTATATIATNTVTWNGAIPASSSITVTINATVDSDATAGGTVTNTAQAAYDWDGDGATNDATVQDSAAFTVSSPATLASPAKSVSGSTAPGSTVTYTIVLTNTGAAAQLDNPGNEMIDVLPSSLTLVDASATSGTAVATIGTNTVTWNGVIAPSATVTITIHATVNAGLPLGTSISNQATVNYDSNGDGTNDASAVTNDPSTGASGDATAFVVASPAMIASAAKTHDGQTEASRPTSYTITFTNTGTSTQFDNPGDEFIDVLPAQLILSSATADIGTVTVDIPARTVRWNGSLAPAETVTITINAVIDPATPAGTTISNQGTVNYDANGDGTNESQVQTNIASFAVTAPAGIPTLSPLALVLLSAFIAAVALKMARG
jgi:uncharacterized repeat protein (TIGR01451 family)/fimbrial isopeptide formation D2 family protein